MSADDYTPTTRKVRLDYLLGIYRVGSGDWPWTEEYDNLIDQPGTQKLLTRIRVEGIREPILLGTDGRVWDGHHRIAVAMHLGIDSVPVEFAGEEGALAAHDAALRAEWEAEQGDPEWEYGYELIESDTRDVLTRGFPFSTRAEAHEHGHKSADEEHDPEYPRLDVLVVKRTKNGPWLPVSDTASESREERSPAEETAPHWSIIRAGNIVIAEGYCWCNDPNGGYHQIGIKPAPVPDTTNIESEDE